jgi:hypothetical protein
MVAGGDVIYSVSPLLFPLDLICVRKVFCVELRSNKSYSKCRKLSNEY